MNIYILYIINSLIVRDIFDINLDITIRSYWDVWFI